MMAAAAADLGKASLLRALVAAERDGAVLQDIVDCGDQAAALGAERDARLLYDIAFLRAGFSPTRQRWQAETAEARGFAVPAAALRDGEPPFSVDLALAELAALLPLAGAGDLPPSDQPLAYDPPPPAVPAPLRAMLSGATAVPELADRCGRLCDLLRSEGNEDVVGEAAAVRASLAADLMPFRPLRMADLADASLHDLIGHFAAGRLRTFLRMTHDLAEAPLGSPALFHAAARLDEAGLGPWFNHVGQVVRTGRELLAFVALAAERSVEAARGEVERWAILLSAGLPQYRQLHLIDDLGDLGMVAALRGMLQRTARLAERRLDRDPVWRIRDAGLDLGDYRLAALAQRLAADWDAANALEWKILGEALATGGAFEEAEEAFVTALALQRRDRDGLRRLRAVRAGDFTNYRLEGGFGSMPSRRRLRAQHRPAEAAPLDLPEQAG